MAGTLSLKELKEQNAQAETEEETKEPIQSKVALVDDYEEESEKVEAVEVETDDSEDVIEGKTDTDSWMQPDEATSESEKTGFKPNHEAAALRKKLRAKLDDKDTELDRLRAENERLKSTDVHPEVLPERPKREDYDYDDEKYDKAIDVWTDKKIELKLNSHNSIKSKEAQAQQQNDSLQGEINEAVDSHYKRAEKLVESGKIGADLYAQSDLVVRKMVESVFPSQGDATTNALINTLNTLGDGSEKVMYQLGINREKRERLETLLRKKDVLGASAYLGSLQASLTSPNKRRSSAPKPSPTIQGDAGGLGKDGALKKQYEKAGSNLQARLDLKRQAKKQGVDVTKW